MLRTLNPSTAVLSAKAIGVFIRGDSYGGAGKGER